MTQEIRVGNEGAATVGVRQEEDQEKASEDKGQENAVLVVTKVEL
jgi:hypothetical protein